MKKFKEFINENSMIQSRMEQIYDDIEEAINKELPIQYKDGDGIKTATPINISSGPSTEPWSNIEFDNGDIIKDYEIIGLVKEGHSQEILPKMVRLSNNSRITQATAERIAEKFDGAEFRDFQVWLGLVEQNQQIKNKPKYY